MEQSVSRHPRFPQLQAGPLRSIEICPASSGILRPPGRTVPASMPSCTVMTRSGRGGGSVSRRNAEYATAAALFDNMTYASGNAARESGRIVGQHCCQLRITAEKLNRSVMVSIRPGYRMWIPSSCSSASPSAASCARSCAMIGALVLAGSLLRVCVSLCRQIS